MTYAELRRLRIEIAAMTDGWGAPTWPFPRRHLGRVILSGRAAGFYPDLNPELDAIFKAREKAQNRRHSPNG